MARNPARSYVYCNVLPQSEAKIHPENSIRRIPVQKARIMTILEDSDDPVVRSIQPQLGNDRKRRLAEAVNRSKGDLKMKEGISFT
ncbi:hypothetical protein PoB_006247800 [Plakobranchus ocellatus]|uniref:Uncharacterized protein n=1 Tax=Plakobranchus ocellatus TaxID=259542 RepID=A0AAV4CVQ5_9GAST|nr:hypothetical protein PoB_006247800 [Plakobranchus ocellatus]